MERSKNSLANNDLEFRLPYNSNVWDYASDAVFGDDDSEIFNHANSDLKTDSAYKEAVEKAIRDGDYRKIILTNDIRDLNISRPVNIDLNGNGLYGTTRASFTDGATCHIYNGKTGTSVVTELDINTPNADWNIEDTGSNNDAGRFSQPNSGTLHVNKVVLRAIPSKTLKNSATIDTITVNTGSNDAKIENAEGGKIGEIVLDNVNKSGTVKIRNYANAVGGVSAIGTIKVNTSVKLDITGDNLKPIDNVIVNASRDVELKMTEGNVTKISGTPTAVTLKDDTGTTVKNFEGTTIESDTEQGVVDLLKKALVDTASVSTVSGASVKDILVNKNGDIDERGTAIKGYKIYVKGISEEWTLTNEGTKFDVDHSLGLSKAGTITIVIKKDGDGKEITVKNITITEKKS